MLITDVLGFSATVILILLYVPQVYKTTKTNTAKDLSINFLILSITGASLMIAYSSILKLIPVLISNCFILIFNIYLFIFKILENNNLKKEPRITLV